MGRQIDWRARMQVRPIGRLMLVALAILLGARFATGGPMVRVGYVIPADRAEQPGAVERLQQLVLDVQDWYGDQMARHGFGRKTFQVETLGDGVTPKIHVVSSSMVSATMRSDTWARPIEAAQDAGLSIWTPGEVWLLSPYSHLQQSGGAISGNTALGASNGSGNDPGVAVIGSDFSFRSTVESLKDTRPYAGMTNSLVGRYPFVQGVTFPGFEGTTISSIASAAQGATAHELGHAFGLAHDFRNDNNFDGNLMGNGLRGWRGSQLPEVFPEDDSHLAYASALALSVSRYFNSEETFTDQTRPSLTVHTSGAVDPTNGKVQISFSAGDSSGLAAALLRRNGETIGEMQVRGRNVATSFSTPYYTPGQNDQFSISVLDNQGNEREVNFSITPSRGLNRAPQPFIDLSRATAYAGQSVVLSAAQSADPDGSASSMLVEWDLDGDGEFDTAPSTAKTLSNVFMTPGNFRVSARITDELGAWAVSTGLVLRVAPIRGDYNGNGIVDAADFTLWRDTVGQKGLGLAADGNRDGEITTADYDVWKAHFGDLLSDLAASTGNNAVPEPTTIALVLTCLAIVLGMGAARRSEENNPSEWIYLGGERAPGPRAT